MDFFDLQHFLGDQSQDFDFNWPPLTEEARRSKQHDQQSYQTVTLPDLPKNAELEHVSASVSGFLDHNTISQEYRSNSVGDVGINANLMESAMFTVSEDTLGVAFGLEQGKLTQLEHCNPSLLKQKPLPRDTLRAWVAQNPEVLYPSNTEKASLCLSTGLNISQISTWFVNYRQRHVKQNSVPSSRVGDSELTVLHLLRESNEILAEQNVILQKRKCLIELHDWTVFEWFARYERRHRSDRSTVLKRAATRGNRLDMQKQNQFLSEEIYTLRKQNDILKSQYDPTNLLDKALLSDSDDCNTSGRTSSDHVVAPSSPKRPLSASQIDYDKVVCNQQSETLSWTSHFSLEVDFLTFWYLTLPEDNCYDHDEIFQKDVSVTRDTQYSNDYIEDRKDSRDRYWYIGPDRTATDMIQDYIGESHLHAPRSSNKLKRRRAAAEQGTYPATHRSTSMDSTSSHRQQANSFDGASGTSGSVSTGASWHSSTSRRGRRIPQTFSESTKAHICPECFQGFSRLGDMNRHMKSIHEPSQVWICRPIGSSQTGSCTTTTPLCLCGSDPSLCGHNMPRCWVLTESQRLFYRIDHIKRHLRVTHRLGSQVETIPISLLKVSL